MNLPAEVKIIEVEVEKRSVCNETVDCIPAG
jgi:hypothetical protein